jgi:hypothetical protein
MRVPVPYRGCFKKKFYKEQKLLILYYRYRYYLSDVKYRYRYKFTLKILKSISEKTEKIEKVYDQTDLKFQ